MSERARFGEHRRAPCRRGRGRHRGPERRRSHLLEGSKLVEAAAAAAAGQQYPAPALYVVATPIGNLADLTLRALHVLALVDAIACEDTRHSAALLRHFAIAKPLIAVHEHNERDAAGAVLARLARGERVAYVSDAGTPAVSDPGAALVAAAHRGRLPRGADPGREQRARRAVGGGRCRLDRLRVRRLSRRARQRANAARSPRCRRRAATQVVFEAPHRIESLAERARRRLPRSSDDAVPRAHQAVRDDRDDAGARAAGVARAPTRIAAAASSSSSCTRWPRPMSADDGRRARRGARAAAAPRCR